MPISTRRATTCSICAGVIFFAYIGFDAVTTTAEEARNPQRDLPIGIMTSLGICTILYVSVAAVLTGLVPYNHIDIHAPVAEALSLVGYKWGAAVVAIGAVAGITSVLVVMMLGQIRIFFAMSRDQLLGPGLSKVHPRFGTPVVLLGALAAPLPVDACAVAPPRDAVVEVASESAIIVWDERAKTEHFIRRATFAAAAPGRVRCANASALKRPGSSRVCRSGCASASRPDKRS